MTSPRLYTGINGTGDDGPLARRWRWTRAVATAVCLLAAACGGPGIDILDRAAQATVDSSDYDLSMTGTVFGADRGVLGTMRSSGVINLAAGTRDMQVEVAPAGTPAYTVDVRALPGEVFQRDLPGFPEDTWLLIDAAPSAISADLPTFVDPQAVVDLLIDLEGSVTDLGEEDIAGVATRHVRVVLPPVRISRSIVSVLAAAVPSPDERPVIDPIEATAVAEVWIDDEDLIRQMSLDTTVTVADGQAIAGIGATDNQLFMQFQPRETPPAVTQPSSETSARTNFAELFRTSQ